jgi:ketosteroid isomerase-like protein
MSEAPVNAFYAAINSGEAAMGLGMLAEDVRWRRPPDVPVTGTIEGLDEARKMWRAFGGSLQIAEVWEFRSLPEAQALLSQS